MTLLECLVGIALCGLILNPLIKISADLFIKQIEYEKKQALSMEADRAFEMIGRAIRMAGYRNISHQKGNKNLFLEIKKHSGFRGSDSLLVRHEVSSGIDFDCIGNVITKERTKNHLALQGFLVEAQAGISKGAKVGGGSLMCQSLDRQGRIQNTTLMNGVNQLLIEEVNAAQAQIRQAQPKERQEGQEGQRLLKVKLKMTDGARLHLDLERTFSTRNLL